LAGRESWRPQLGQNVLALLADKMVELRYVDGLSDETVRRTLRKTASSRG